MADKNRTQSIQEKIRQALEKLGEALDGWLPKPRLQPRPVPIDRPYRRKERANKFNW